MQSHTKKSSILLFAFLHITLLIMSFSGVMSKSAAGEAFLSLRFCLFYGGMILILGVYAICWQQLIKRLPLSLAYANKAVTVIWGMVWGVMFFGEQITAKKLIGAAIVIVGVVLYSMENNNERD